MGEYLGTVAVYGVAGRGSSSLIKLIRAKTLGKVTTTALNAEIEITKQTADKFSRRTYLNQKFGRTGNLHADINARSGLYPPKDGFIYRELTELQKGMRFDRYGGFIDELGSFKDFGRYSSPVGTPFSQRSLPLESLNKPYKAYEVIKPFSAEAGPIAPWFNQPGNGTQYFLPKSIQKLIDSGFIKPL